MENNNRVAKIISAAARHGYATRKSDVADNCWIISGADRDMLVYSGINHSCYVYLTSMSRVPTGDYMPQITQRSALHMFASHTL